MTSHYVWGLRNVTTCDKDGGGFKKLRKSCDVIYGWPLSNWLPSCWWHSWTRWQKLLTFSNDAGDISAHAVLMLSRSPINVCVLLLYSMDMKYLQRKNYCGVRSGDLADHSKGPRRPISTNNKVVLWDSSFESISPTSEVGRFERSWLLFRCVDHWFNVNFNYFLD